MRGRAGVRGKDGAMTGSDGEVGRKERVRGRGRGREKEMSLSVS